MRVLDMHGLHHVANGRISLEGTRRFARVLRLVARRSALLALLGLPLTVQAGPVTYDLQFTTSGQSMWGPGGAFIFEQTKFLGAAWRNKRSGVDLLAGNEGVSVINPARLAYDAAFATCNLAFSASACINGQSARVPVPALGSRPSVRSCGRFNVVCQARRVGDLAARASYDLAFSTCRLGFSSSVCRNGQSAQLPVVALGTPPPLTLELDTRTGVAVAASSDGRVGLELGIAIDSGSVDVSVAYQASLEIPDTTLEGASRTINFNTNSLLSDNSLLATTFPNVQLYLDAIMQLSGAVTAEACAIPFGCTSGGSSFDINERAPILSFNRAREGEILVFGQTPSDLFLPVPDGFPAAFDIAGIAEITLHLPQPDTSGGVDPATESLKSAAQDDLLDVIIDLDNVVATSVGLPGLFGRALTCPLGSVSFDIINVEMGPTIDLRQEFEFDPGLFVQLAFDEAVMIGGNVLNSFIAPWDLLPDITFLSDVTQVTPTFFVEGDLRNRTLLDLDLEFGIDLLQVGFDFGVLGEGGFGIGNVLDQGVDLFQSPDLFNRLFPLAGFDLQIGDSFVIDFIGGSTAPQSLAALSAVNPIILQANPERVSEPAPILLLLFGLLGLLYRHLVFQQPLVLRAPALKRLFVQR
jgi:hypothetical protein